MIAVGSLRSEAALIHHALRGATVLNCDVPFLTLLAWIEGELRADRPAARSRDAAVRVVAGVRARAAEFRALSGLTHREREVLGGLIHGHPAFMIAMEGSRSLPTVRSQIRTLMGRLGVSSQLGAVALAHRSGRHAGLGERLDALQDL